MAVKATLRTPAVIAEAQAKAVQNVTVLKEATPTPAAGVTVESTTTVVASQSADFDKNLFDPTEAPPVDNAHVAPGAEQFSNTETTTAVATQETGAVSAPQISGDEGEFEGEFDQSDLRFPTLTIVQGSTGPLIEAGFAQGDLVFNNELVFQAPRPKEKSPLLRVIPISLVKSYREVLSKEQMDEGAIPRLFKTKAEVAAAGLSLTWFNNPEPCVRKSAKIVLLVEAPEATEHPGFGVELDGKTYALGNLYAKTGAYAPTADRIWNNYMTILFVPVVGPDGKPVIEEGRPKKRRCIYKNFWKFSWGQVKAGNFNPWRPDMTLTKDATGPELREFCANLLRGRNEVHGD